MDNVKVKESFMLKLIGGQMTKEEADVLAHAKELNTTYASYEEAFEGGKRLLSSLSNEFRFVIEKQYALI